METNPINESQKTRQKVMWYSFAAVLGGCILTTLISMAVNPYESATSMFFQWFTDTYMDFFNCVSQNYARTIYTSIKSIYPPLMNLMYMVLGFFIPHMDPRPLSQSAEGICLFYIVHISCTILFLFSVWLNCKGLSTRKRIITVLLSAVSLPVIFCFERGNSIILAVACILFFNVLYKSPVRYRRHAGLLLLAVAANMKFWPALFGLVLIKEKRWKDAAFCVLYGVLLFVLPMMIYAGFETPFILAENIKAASAQLNDWGIGYKINWGNFFRILERAYGLSVPGFTVNIMAAVVGICALITRRKAGLYLGIALICTGFPAFSFNYNGLYLFLPICAYLILRGDISICDIIMMILLAFAISPIGINLLGSFYPLSLPGEGQHLNLSTCVSCVSVFVMSVLFVCETIWRTIRERHISIWFIKQECELAGNSQTMTVSRREKVIVIGVVLIFVIFSCWAIGKALYPDGASWVVK